MNGNEYALTAVQQRTVLALAKEMARIEVELAECRAAMDELAGRYAQDANAPAGRFLFVQGPDGAVRLQVVPAEPEPELPAEPCTAES